MNQNEQDISIILLAGGKSKRMGRDKGLININGKTLLEQTIKKLEKISRNILIISNQSGYDQFKYPVYNDLKTNKGPIGGIYTGLTHSKSEINIIIACDMPNLTTDFLNFMIESHKPHCDATIAVYKERIQPLSGLYNKYCRNKLETQIETGNYRMSEALKVLQTNYVSIPKEIELSSPHLFDNLNTIEDLKMYRNIYKWK